MKNYILLSILLCGGNTLLAGGDDERELTLRDHSPISSTGAVVNGGEFEVVIIDPEGNPVEVEGLERVGTPDPRWNAEEDERAKTLQKHLDDKAAKALGINEGSMEATVIHRQAKTVDCLQKILAREPDNAEAINRLRAMLEQEETYEQE